MVVVKTTLPFIATVNTCLSRIAKRNWASRQVKSHDALVHVPHTCRIAKRKASTSGPVDPDLPTSGKKLLKTLVLARNILLLSYLCSCATKAWHDQHVLQYIQVGCEGKFVDNVRLKKFRGGRACCVLMRWQGK